MQNSQEVLATVAKRLIGLVALLLLVTALTGWAGSAQAQVQSGLPSSVSVGRNTAMGNFPNGITFQFNATVAPGPLNFKSIDLAYQLQGEVATTIRHTKLDAGSPLQASIELNTQDDYIPPGTRINYYWLITDDQNNVYQAPTQTFTYQDTRYNFNELKQGVLTVRWYEGNQTFGQTALDKAQATVTRLGQLYSVKPDNPINITIYPDTRTMFTALPPNTQEWVGGQAMPELGTIVIDVPPGDLQELGRSIPHEVSHQVVYQATRNPYNVPPKWLDEGLAVNNQDKLDTFLVQAYTLGRTDHTLFSLRVLDAAFPADTQQSFLAYGQSVMVVRYIINKYGDGAIQKMLAAFKQGLDYDQIVESGIGIDIDTLDYQWKQSINYPVTAPPVVSQATATANLTPLSSPGTIAVSGATGGSTGGATPTLQIAPGTTSGTTPLATSQEQGQAAILPATATPIVPVFQTIGSQQATPAPDYSFWIYAIPIGFFVILIGAGYLVIARKNRQEDYWDD